MVDVGKRDMGARPTWREFLIELERRDTRWHAMIEDVQDEMRSQQNEKFELLRQDMREFRTSVLTIVTIGIAIVVALLTIYTITIPK